MHQYEQILILLKKTREVDWWSNINKTKELFHLPDFAIHFVASDEDFLVYQPL